ncbi:MAG: nuclear transport factor 2 family protein [Candidatus Melainabacteria bacterium]|nr:MAG: nuclear transport factor 2 family protein [Candidatus Melainabacteria bacterium]
MVKRRNYQELGDIELSQELDREVTARINQAENELATHKLITEAYSAFNRRDIDSALALMSEYVSWPKASEGGRASGKEEVRAYWTRQWQEFDPHVEPVEIMVQDNFIAKVRVQQVVKSLGGDILFDGEVGHFYTIVNGLIERMDIM